MTLERLNYVPFTREAIKIENKVLDDGGDITMDTWESVGADGQGYAPAVDNCKQQMGKPIDEVLDYKHTLIADRLPPAGDKSRYQELVVADKGQLIRLSWLNLKDASNPNARILREFAILDNAVLDPELLSKLTDAQIQKFIPDILENFKTEMAAIVETLQSCKKPVAEVNKDALKAAIKSQDAFSLGKIINELYNIDSLEASKKAAYEQNIEWAVLHYDYLKYAYNLGSDISDGVQDLDPTGHTYNLDIGPIRDAIYSVGPDWAAAIRSGADFNTASVDSMDDTVIAGFTTSAASQAMALEYVQSLSSMEPIAEIRPAMWNDPVQATKYLNLILDRIADENFAALPKNKNDETITQLFYTPEKDIKWLFNSGKKVKIDTDSGVIKAKFNMSGENFVGNEQPGSNMQKLYVYLKGIAESLGIAFTPSPYALIDMPPADDIVDYNAAAVIAAAGPVAIRATRTPEQLLQEANELLDEIIAAGIKVTNDNVDPAVALTQIIEDNDHALYDGGPTSYADTLFVYDQESNTISINGEFKDNVHDVIQALLIIKYTQIETSSPLDPISFIAGLPIYEQKAQFEEHPVSTIWGKKEISEDQKQQIRARAQWVADNPIISEVTITGLADQGSTSYANWRRDKGNELFIQYLQEINPARAAEVLIIVSTLVDADETKKVGIDFKFRLDPKQAEADLAVVDEVLLPAAKAYITAKQTGTPTQAQAAAVVSAINQASETNRLHFAQRVDAGLANAGIADTDVLRQALKIQIQTIEAERLAPPAPATPPATAFAVSASRVEIDKAAPTFQIPYTGNGTDTKVLVKFGDGTSRELTVTSRDGGVLTVQSIWVNKPCTQLLDVGGQQVTLKIKGNTM